MGKNDTQTGDSNSDMYDEIPMHSKFGNDDRKRKRALRNKERLANHQCKLLDSFISGVNAGFSDENWADLAGLFSQISDFLAPEERRALGQLWRESFCDTVSPSRVENTVGLVKLRLGAAAD